VLRFHLYLSWEGTKLLGSGFLSPPSKVFEFSGLVIGQLQLPVWNNFL